MCPSTPFISKPEDKERLEIEKLVRKMRHANMWKGSVKELTRRRSERPEMFTIGEYGISMCRILDSVKVSVIQRSFLYDLFIGYQPLEDVKKWLASLNSEMIDGAKLEEKKRASAGDLRRSKRGTKSQQCVVVNP